MHVRSVALTTELQLAATGGRVIDRDDYLVVATPTEPSYYFGNLLVWPAAPQVGEIAYWLRRFADELGRDPAIRHVAFRWDGTTGDVGARHELVAAGFTVWVHDVMRATTVTAAPTSYALRPLRPDELVADAELAYAISDQHDEGFRAFTLRRAAWKRTLVERGLATWWGAFAGAQLVGSLGLARFGTLGRYQDVQTATAHRQRGIASALLAAAAADARAAGVEQLVIVVEPDSPASRVYARAGFAPIERTASAFRAPKP